MNHRVTTGVSSRGGALALKRASDEAGAARLRHEAAMLQLAKHPGVVELVACERDETGVVTLATEFVGLHSLDTVGSLSVERAAAIVAAVASTLADLHNAGVVHGRVEPSHILIGASGQAKLCGFGASAADGSLSPSVDVAGAGAVLRELVARPRDDGWGRYRRRALLAIAEQANDPEPSRRPPARRLAAAIRGVVPEADGVPASTLELRAHWFTVLVVALVVVAMVAILL